MAEETENIELFENEEKEIKECECGKKCNECGGKSPLKLSITRGDFWDLWGQKMFRNVASMKFQWMVILCAIVVWGMFFKTLPGDVTKPLISAELGLGFLGGGFITLATSRIIARTKLTEPSNGDLDTDK
jgi:hypothetical protein